MEFALHIIVLIFLLPSRFVEIDFQSVSVDRTSFKGEGSGEEAKCVRQLIA